MANLPQPSAPAKDSSNPATATKAPSELPLRLFAPGPSPYSPAWRDRRDRRDRLEKYLAGVGPRLAGATSRNYECRCPEQEKLVEQLRSYYRRMRKHVQQGSGIVLHGPSGTGKDHLLVALAKAGIERHGYSVRHVFGVDLYSELRDRIGDDSSTEEMWVQGLVRSTILVLSDPVPPRGALSEFQSAMLQRVVNKRYNERRPTWVTLNAKSSQEADALLSPAIVDRLKHDALVCYCNWPSHRKPMDPDSVPL